MAVHCDKLLNLLFLVFATRGFDLLRNELWDSDMSRCCTELVAQIITLQQIRYYLE